MSRIWLLSKRSRDYALGMHVLRADGLWGMVTGWKVVPGTKVMYNLEVAQDHTFTVGADEWVVHNMCAYSPVFKLLRFLGNKTDETRINENLPPRMVRGGPSTPNVAAALVSYMTGNGGMSEWETFVSGRLGHSEQQAVDWGADRLTSLVNQYGSGGDASLTVVTQYWPCGPDSLDCAGNISGGSWQSMLDAATGGNVDFQVWHYRDNGSFGPFR